MSQLRWLPALVIGLALLVPIGGTVRADAPAAEKLIQQLGSKRFADREAAARGLDALGELALPALHKAALSPDSEVRQRARTLIERIEKRLETARLLAPKKVHLVLKDMPVLDAIADLARRTGFNIQFEGDRVKLAKRNITLDTGETTFWNALDLLCRHGGLSEKPPAPRPNMADPTRYYRGGRVWSARTVRPNTSATAENRVTLIDAKPAELSSFLAGALRIRALPSNTPIVDPGAANPYAAMVKAWDPNTGLPITPAPEVKDKNEILFAVEVSPEPKMSWDQVIDLRINKAVDEHGQRLSQVAQETSMDLNLGGGNVIVMDMDSGKQFAPPGQGQVPLRLRQGEKPSKTLRELHGTLFARVPSPMQPIITVPDVFKAVGQSVKDDEIGTLQVVEATRLGDDRVRIRIQVGRGSDNIGIAGRRVIRMNGGFMIVQGDDPSTGLPGAELALMDDKGRDVPQISSSSGMTVVNNTMVREWTVVYRFGKEQSEARKLVLRSRKNVIVEVPFALKDVQLPQPAAPAGKR